MGGHERGYLLTNAHIPTVGNADAVLVNGRHIRWVGRGSERPSWIARIREVDLAGRTLLPGFTDCHTHFLHQGLCALGLRTELAGLGRDETLFRLEAVAAAAPRGLWVVGVGWDESAWDPPTPLSRGDLDRIAPGMALAAFRVDGHKVVVNRVGLERLPASVSTPAVQHEQGVLLERAAFDLSRATLPPRPVAAEALEAGIDGALALGVTSTHAMASREEVPAYFAARLAGRLRITVYAEVALLKELESLGIRSGFGDSWLRFGGVKLFADGSIGAGNAAVGEPFLDGSGAGRTNYRDEELVRFLERAESAGLQTAIHAIGDRAIEQVLSAHERVGTSPLLRHRIEHFELPREDHLDRVAKLGLCLSMQPNFTGRWSGPNSMYERKLGAGRDRRSNPHRLALERGIPLAFGSDSMPMGPLYGIRCLLEAPYPDQRLPLAEAIAGYTEAGGRIAVNEPPRGRIAEGELADLIIFDHDPFAEDAASEVAGAAVTIVDGCVAFRDPACGELLPDLPRGV